MLERGYVRHSSHTAPPNKGKHCRFSFICVDLRPVVKLQLSSRQVPALQSQQSRGGCCRQGSGGWYPEKKTHRRFLRWSGAPQRRDLFPKRNPIGQSLFAPTGIGRPRLADLPRSPRKMAQESPLHLWPRALQDPGTRFLSIAFGYRCDNLVVQKTEGVQQKSDPGSDFLTIG